jgi:hypothetical protein
VRRKRERTHTKTRRGKKTRKEICFLRKRRRQKKMGPEGDEDIRCVYTVGSDRGRWNKHTASTSYWERKKKEVIISQEKKEERETI